MTSRRKFIATSAVVAMTASILPKTGRGEPSSALRGEEEEEGSGDVKAGEGSAELRRVRARAALGQSVPLPGS